MALALVLRNTSKVQSIVNQNILKTAIKIDSRKSFTQMVSGIKKDHNKLQPSVLVKTTNRFMSADHSKLWPIEKAVSVLVLGLVPSAIVAPNVVLDDLLAISTVVHFHWGLEACVVDYVRPIILGHTAPKVALALLYLISISTLGGLLYYNHSSIGIGNTVRKVWKS